MGSMQRSDKNVWELDEIRAQNVKNMKTIEEMKAQAEANKTTFQRKLDDAQDAFNQADRAKKKLEKQVTYLQKRVEDLEEENRIMLMKIPPSEPPTPGALVHTLNKGVCCAAVYRKECM